MDYKVGDKIPVKVGDRIFETVIDERGVQRFHRDPILTKLLDSAFAARTQYYARVAFPKPEIEFYTLNEIVIDYYEDKYTLDEMLTFYTSIGYSVSGFCDLSIFEDLEVLNPVWGDEL